MIRGKFNRYNNEGKEETRVARVRLWFTCEDSNPFHPTATTHTHRQKKTILLLLFLLFLLLLLLVSTTQEGINLHTTPIFENDYSE